MITFVEYPVSVNLRRLLSARSWLLVALTLFVVVVALAPGVVLPLGPIAAIIGALALTTALGWSQMAVAKRPPNNVEIVLQLGVDIAALTGLLYFTGGWTNPLVSLYLVPIAAAAVMLPPRSAWAVAVGAVLCYALVAAFYQPLVHEGSGMGPFAMHVLGMWLTFVIAAALIAYFGTTMAATLRSRAKALATARETNLRNEQIIGVATLAAGTAHELSTPIGSIAVIATELKDEVAPQQASQLELIISQIDVCKEILRRLRDAAAPSGDIRDRVQRVGEFFDDIRDRFELLRPTANVEFRVERNVPSPFIVAEPTLRQAILNLLNNAADASPRSVECSAHWTTQHLVLDIRDRGTGFDRAAGHGDRYDSPGGSTANASPDGMGMGLLLANATIERLGGSVHIADRDGGGAWVKVTIPLAVDSILVP